MLDLMLVVKGKGYVGVLLGPRGTGAPGAYSSAASKAFDYLNAVHNHLISSRLAHFYQKLACLSSM